MRVAKLLTAVTLAVAGLAAPALALTPAENRLGRYAAFPLPHCASPEVLGYVTSQFHSRETIYWHTGLQIGGYDRVRERGLRPWGANFVPRRFCSARAHMSDGHLRHVNYYVREILGPFGNSWEVTWCVTGLDRHRTYAPNCEQATPW